MALSFMGTPIVDPDDVGIGRIILGVSWAFTALVIFTVALRFYIRRRFQSEWVSDDWLMLAALATHIVAQGLFTESILWGFGKEYLNLTMEEYMGVQKYEFLTMPFVYVTELLARLSIAIVLVRIFGITRPWFKWFMIVFTVATWITGIVSIALVLAQVSPIEAFWDPMIKPTRKMSQYVNADSGLVFQFFILITDLLFVVLPVSFVWKLTMQKKRKIGLVILLSVSLITVGIQSAKIALAIKGMLGKITFQEAGYLGAVFYIVTFAEESILIIMGCVPVLGPISKINVPILASFSDSITKLFTGRDRSSKGSSPSSIRHDIESGGKPRTPDEKISFEHRGI